MTKKALQNVASVAGTIFTTYNLRRISNIIDRVAMTKYMREHCSLKLVQIAQLPTVIKAIKLIDCPYCGSKNNTIFKKIHRHRRTQADFIVSFEDDGSGF